MPRSCRLVRLLAVGLCAATVSTVAASPALAEAGDKRIAILGLEAEEGLEAVAGAVTRSVRRVAAVRSGWRVAAVGSLSVTEVKLTYACMDDDPACWTQVGGALDVDLLVAGSVIRGVDGLLVTLLLYDVREVRLIDRLEREFVRDELDRGMAAAVRAMLQPVVEPEPEPEPPPPAPVAVAPAPAPTPPPAGAAQGPAPAAQASGPRSAPSSRRFLGWGILGAGATLAGVGLLFGVLAQDAVTEFDLPETPERRAHELKDRGERYAAGANALYGVGVALGVTGAVLLVFAPKGGDEAITVGPTVGQDTHGLIATGSF